MISISRKEQLKKKKLIGHVFKNSFCHMVDITGFSCTSKAMKLKFFAKLIIV